MMQNKTRLLSVLALLLLSPGCTNSKANHPLTQPFPDGFLWGTATAGFQVDMGCPGAPCLDTASDWYQWVTSDVTIDSGLVEGDLLEDGPGHWELFAGDFDLARDQLHNNAYRMAIEWSRIFPTSTEGLVDVEELHTIADPDAVQRYHEMFDALIERGMTPLVTLNHYAMPLWIHNGVACHLAVKADNIDACADQGWLDPDRLIPEIAKFSRFVAQEYGSKVDLWATLNEPSAVYLSGFAIPEPSQRTNPPGIADFSFKYARNVILAMIEAHARMYDAVHAGDTQDADGNGVPTQVGIVLNLASAYPNTPGDLHDEKAVENFNYFYNKLFMDAIVDGQWDPGIDGTPDETRADLAGRLDYAGINYYSSVNLVGGPDPIAEFIPVLTFLPTDTDFFAVKPRGLYEVVMFAAERYDLPIYITENGTPVQGETSLEDTLIGHLSWLRKAITDGADVRGYFYWSLLDNYEWNHGYDLQFGMYEYADITKARSPRPVADLYGQIASGNRLTPEMLENYGAELLPEE